MGVKLAENRKWKAAGVAHIFNVFSRLLDNKVQGHLQHYHTTSMVSRKGMDWGKRPSDSKTLSTRRTMLVGWLKDGGTTMERNPDVIFNTRPLRFALAAVRHEKTAARHHS